MGCFSQPLPPTPKDATLQPIFDIFDATWGHQPDSETAARLKILQELDPSPVGPLALEDGAAEDPYNPQTVPGEGEKDQEVESKGRGLEAQEAVEGVRTPPEAQPRSPDPQPGSSRDQPCPDSQPDVEWTDSHPRKDDVLALSPEEDEHGQPHPASLAGQNKAAAWYKECQTLSGEARTLLETVPPPTMSDSEEDEAKHSGLGGGKEHDFSAPKAKASTKQERAAILARLSEIRPVTRARGFENRPRLRTQARNGRHPSSPWGKF